VWRDYIALFGAGVASFLAPCLVPLLPAYLGIIVGESADAHDTATAVPATLIFVLGFAAVFASFGVVAGLVGQSLSPVKDTVQRIGGVVIIIFGLAMLGILRGPLSRERRAITKLPRLRGPVRPFVIGVAFGQPVRGGLLLLSYALGIGVPFILASLGLASSPRLGIWMRKAGPRIERLGGALLVVLGLLLITGAYQTLTSYLARFTPAIGGL
jgi:cytochrome c-type biogenesis protein